MRAPWIKGGEGEERSGKGGKGKENREEWERGGTREGRREERGFTSKNVQ